jgi:hypothetical protein
MNNHDLEEDFPLSGGKEPDDVNIIMVIITVIIIIGVIAYKLIKLM